MKTFKTDGFKLWNKNVVNNDEFVNYVTYQNNSRDRIVLFERAADLIECFNKNVSAYGGKDIWKDDRAFKEHLTKDAKHKWAFGEWETLNKTEQALNDGTALEKFIEDVDNAKEELYKEIPQLNKLNTIAISKRRRRKFGEDGELDIDRFMSCDPDYFFTMPKQDVANKVARIYIDICVSGGTKYSVIAKNMALAAAMCDIVERAGISIEIIVGATSDGGATDTNLYNICCKAKEANEPLDLSRLMTFAMPGFFRHFVFGCWGNITNTQSGYGFGRVMANLSNPFFDFFDADIKFRGEEAFYSPKNIEMWFNGIEKILNIENLKELR